MREIQAKETNRKRLILGLSTDMMNSINLFLYHYDKPNTNIFTLYNDWIEYSGIKGIDLETSMLIIEYMDKMVRLSHEDLKQLIADDHFLLKEE